MRVEIMAVGTEVVRGEILNSNAQRIAQGCVACGVPVVFHSAVEDDKKSIIHGLQCAFSRADCVITTGGLGPTLDDLTKETCADFLQLECVLHEPSLEYIRMRFSESNREMPKNNEKQAYFPKNATVLPNPNGTAPGCIMFKDEKIIINLPGPPGEMVPMFNEHIIPFLHTKADAVYVCRFFHISGVGESAIATALDDIMNSENPVVAPYAKDGEVSLRVMARAATIDAAKELIEPVETIIRHRIGDSNIFGTDDTTLESALVELLRRYQLTIAIAESCTGGLCTARLVNVAGVSIVLKDGVVAYSNESKILRLGVSGESISRYGAVSAETAQEMARGIAQTSEADIGVGITGVAGPGQSENKPAGLVYVAVSIRGVVKTIELRLKGSRDKIRAATVTRAIDFVRRQILETFL